MAERQVTETATSLPLSRRGSVRQRVGAHGRVHLDRFLPFIVLHRGPESDETLAGRITRNASSYLRWEKDDDEEALRTLDALIDPLCDKCGNLLVITLEDIEMPRPEHGAPKLPPFVVEMGRQGAKRVDAAAGAIEKGLKGIEIDLRRCKVRMGDLSRPLGERVEDYLEGRGEIRRISLKLPPIHLRPDGGLYPELFHDLSMRIGDVLLRGACAFMAEGPQKAPKHYRTLGRSAYLKAALNADRKLTEISRSFDFLLSISPIDTQAAREEFLAGGAEQAPNFHYRPLTVDPDDAKRALYDINLDNLEDPLLEELLVEKRREIDAQLTLLATRNTPQFRPASMMLYGMVDAPLLEDAEMVLSSTAKDPPRGETVGAEELAEAALDMVEEYRAIDERFDAHIEIRDDVAGLMVSGSDLLVGSEVNIPRDRVFPLLSHEVSTHLLTYFNGAAQGLGMFSTGMAGYEGIQEGLGVFAEWAVGGLTRTRLRLLAGRVLIVDAMQKGADFISCYRLLHEEHGFSESGAFGIVARVFRSGGLAKDAIYLKGFRDVISLVADGVSLEPFWLGKIAPRHAPAIEELLQRKLVRPPIFRPLYFDRQDTRDRLARLRKEKDMNLIWVGE